MFEYVQANGVEAATPMLTHLFYLRTAYTNDMFNIHTFRILDSLQQRHVRESY